MAGRLGADFVASDPQDSDKVKNGAGWIRDIKNRLKNFCGVLFSLETGKIKPDSIPYTALTDLAPLPTGTWREVTVNSKGLVTSGSNPTDISRPVSIYRGLFNAGGGQGAYDTDAGYSTLVWPGSSVYSGSGPRYIGTYAASNYARWAFPIPSTVRRIKCWVVGGGGGSSINAGGTQGYGGASAEHREAVIPVTGTTTLEIVVGVGGAGNAGGAASAGGTSQVITGDTYIEAGGGGGATQTAHGAPQAGLFSNNVTGIIMSGEAGAAAAAEGAGAVCKSYLHSSHVAGIGAPHGSGGSTTLPTAGDGEHGLVLIEWVQ